MCREGSQERSMGSLWWTLARSWMARSCPGNNSCRPSSVLHHSAPSSALYGGTVEKRQQHIEGFVSPSHSYLQSRHRRMALSRGTSSGCHATIRVSRHWRSRDMQSDQATPRGRRMVFNQNWLHPGSGAPQGLNTSTRADNSR